MARRFNILLVDDDPDILALLNTAFRSRDYSVTVASDGDTALKALSPGNFDLVITDLHLGSTDGFVILSNAKRLNPETTVYVMTGDTNANLAAESVRKGADDFFLKPFSFVALLKQVALLASRSRPAQTLEEALLQTC